MGYTIKDLEQLSGIKSHTIRMWERRYKCFSPDRTKTNIRLYNDNHLKRLLNIAILLRTGKRISDVANLSDKELYNLVYQQTEGLDNTSLQMEHLMQAMIDLNEKSFLKIIEKATIKNGFDYTLENLISPFMEQIGLLWLTGIINPAREHFVSSLIKQKILAATDHLTQFLHPRSPIAVLALHEKELHEISLLMANYFSKKAGFRTIYLGQATPIDSLLEVLLHTHAKLFITAFITPQENQNIQNFLSKITITLPELNIFATGIQILENKYPLPNQVLVIRDIKSLKENLKLVAQKSLQK